MEIKKGDEILIKGTVLSFEEDEILDLEIATSESTFFVNSEDVQVLPKKVVIPKFVAEWIEKTKRTYNLYGAMGHIKDNSAPFEIMKWFSTNPTLTGEILARAWLDGYEIEQEQLYTVEVPNPNSKGTNKFYLCKDSNTQKVYLCKGNFNPKKNKNLWLTEPEIKQDFEWAWKWAKPVEE